MNKKTSTARQAPAGPPGHHPPVYRPQLGATAQAKLRQPAPYRPNLPKPAPAAFRRPPALPQPAKRLIQRASESSAAAPAAEVVSFREQTIFCHYSPDDGSYSWVAKFNLSAHGSQAGLIIQHVTREFQPEGSAKMTQTFYEAWETDFDGGDVTTGDTVFNRSAPMDNFGGSLPWTGSATLSGTLYFVPASHPQFSSIKASFKKNTPGVPKEITMPTATAVNGSLGNPVGQRVLRFSYDKRERKATLSVTAGGQAIKVQEI